MNTVKALFFLLVLTVFLILLGDLIAGVDGIYAGVLIALLTNITAFFSSDQAMLNLYHAKAMSDDTYPHLHALVKTYAVKAGIPTPTLYLIDSNAANLFAVGRNPKRASIAVTKGLPDLLTEEEQAAAIAQAIAKICDRSTFLNGVTAMVAGSFSGLANLRFSEVVFDEKDPANKPGFNEKVMRVVAPIAALLIKSSVAKHITLESDHIAAQQCQHPEWLASTLEKLEANKLTVPFSLADERPATSNLFLVNPLHDTEWAKRFHNLPTTAVRIEALKRS